MATASGNHQLFIRLDPLISLNQIVKPFFGNKSCKKQNKTAALKPILFVNFSAFPYLGPVNSIRYIVGLSPIGFQEIFFHIMR